MDAKQAIEIIKSFSQWLPVMPEEKESMDLLISIAERAGDVEGIHKYGIMGAEVGELDEKAISRWLLTGRTE